MVRRAAAVRASGTAVESTTSIRLGAPATKMGRSSRWPWRWRRTLVMSPRCDNWRARPTLDAD
eukprot:4408668-Prymnesium_polylepis.1